MRVQFWGTRGSIAKPGPATARYGGNTSCVEVRSERGTLVVIDCGTGGPLNCSYYRRPRSTSGVDVDHTPGRHPGHFFFDPLLCGE